jgi:hypothetical protein
MPNYPVNAVWLSCVSNACEKVCAIPANSKINRTAYDVPDGVLWDDYNVLVQAVMLFYRDVSKSVAASPSHYKIVDYELENIGSSRYRMWFDLRPTELYDLAR